MKSIKYFLLILSFIFITTQVFAENHDEKPKIPVCKDGGVNSKINPLYCCKNGYTLGFNTDIDGKVTEDYFTYAPQLCGCPDGGTIMSDELCHKNGYKYHNYIINPNDFIKYPDMKKGEYALTASPDKIHVICPAGTEKKKEDCCKNGYSIQGINEYYKPEVCGCPDKGVYAGYGQCVLDNTWLYNIRDKKYNMLSPSEYNCPKETKKVRFNSFTYCCKNGFAYDKTTDAWTKFEVACGCPNGGETSRRTFGFLNSCCKNGYKYNYKTNRYDIKDDFVCPITITQKIKSKIKDWFDSAMLIITFPYWALQSLH